MSDYIIPAQAKSFCQLGKRDEQQDARYPDCDTPQAGARTFIVCDGVGGQADGSIASTTVCKAFADYMDGYANPAYELTQSAFRDALSFAYQRLLKAIGQRQSDMATTLTFLHFNARNAMVAHMGDSRVYQIRPGVGILYQTSDHSLVNALVHSGNLTPEQAIDHPKGNVITRCMCYTEPGAEPSAADVIVLTDIEAGDYFLLCTDGVLHQIDEQYIIDLFSSDLTDDGKIEALARICQDSSDNNTAIFVMVEDAPREGSAFGDTTPNEEVESVTPSNPSPTPVHQEQQQQTPLPDQETQKQPTSVNPMATCPIDCPQPEISRVAPDNALPFHKKLANRLRNLFS